MKLNAIDSNHYNVIKNFESIFSVSDRLAPVKSDSQVIKELYNNEEYISIWNDQSLVFIERKKDQIKAIHSPRVIKLILPSGLKETLNLSPENRYLKMCIKPKSLCYKAEVVALVDSFPAFVNGISRFSYIKYAGA